VRDAVRVDRSGRQFHARVGQHNSKVRLGDRANVCPSDPIGVNADALVLHRDGCPAFGARSPARVCHHRSGASDTRMKEDAAFAVQTAAGTVDPQWGWFFGSFGRHMAGYHARANRRRVPRVLQGTCRNDDHPRGVPDMDPDGYTVTVDAGASQAIS